MKDMKMITAGGMLAMALLAGACARRDAAVPAVPLAGYSGGGPGAGLGAGLGGLGPDGQIVGGTLPGTSISDTVLFDVDQSTLTPAAIATLDAQIGWLRQNPVAVEIQGHADERGTREYNLALGSARASAVRNYMVSQGVEDSRISIITFGRERPVATCADESCWSQNRRAVTVATGAGV
jgi:peptidoglycan-associated lipoprotein